MEEEAWRVRVAGKEKALEASVKACVRQLLYWVPAAFRGTVPSTSKEMRVGAAARGRAHVPVDLSL